ncbi:MAG: hypothetical protein U0169_11430 [Polyangiaceae bacterium]
MIAGTVVGCVKDGTAPLEARVRAMRERRAHDKQSQACIEKAITDAGYAFDATHSDREHLVSAWRVVDAKHGHDHHDKGPVKGKKAPKAMAANGTNYVRVKVTSKAPEADAAPVAKVSIEAKACPANDSGPEASGSMCSDDPAEIPRHDAKFESLQIAVDACVAPAKAAP